MNPYLASVKRIQPGLTHTCAIGAGADDGAVLCWDGNTRGQLGQGDDVPHRVPVRVVGLANVTQLAASSWTCALPGDGSVKCWGDYDSGVGDPSPSGSMAPTAVAGAGRLVEIAAAGTGACGRTERGEVGWGPLDALTGDRTPVRRAFSVAGVAHARSLSAGGLYCAVVAGDAVMCWGGGEAADVQHATNADGVWRPDGPVGAKGFDRAVEVAVGSDASCVRTEAREVSFWFDKKLVRVGLRDVVKVVVGKWPVRATHRSGKSHCVRSSRPTEAPSPSESVMSGSTTSGLNSRAAPSTDACGGTRSRRRGRPRPARRFRARA